MNKRITVLIALLSLLSLGYSQKRNTFSAYKTDNQRIYGICLTSKGQALGVADNNTIKVFRTDSKELIGEFKNGHKSQILTIDISKDSSILVSGGKDSTLIIWNFINKKILKSLTFQKGIISSVQISPNGKFLISGGTDNKVYLFDIVKNNVVGEFNKHTNDITSVAFTPDGNFFASAAGDKSINIYDTEKGTLITTLKGHRNWVRAISFSRDGSRLISCGDDGQIISWNVSDKRHIQIQNRSKHGLGWLSGIDFNGDSKTYSFGDINGKITIIHGLGFYKTKINTIINKILFKPCEGTNLKLAVATMDRGVLLIDAKSMESSR
jgi:WD40 repeat protein